MLGLINNEIIKLHYRKKFLITLIVFSILCALFAFACVKISEVQKPDNQINMINQQISTIDKLKQQENDSKKKAQYDDTITQLKEELSKIELMKNSQTSDWKSALKENINTLTTQKDTASDMSTSTSKENYNKQIIVDQYLLNNNIKPTADSDISAFSYLQQLFELIGSIFIPIIIAIIAADIVSGECTPPTLKVLLTRPVSRGKVLLSKFLACTLSSVVVIVSVELLSYVIMGLIFGFGNPLYPVAIGTTYKNAIVDATVGSSSVLPILGSSHIIAAWQFILISFLFQIIFIFACAAIFFLFSTLLKSSSISTTLSILLTIAIAILSQIPYLNKITPFLFTTYGSADLVVKSSIPSQINITYVTPAFAVGFLLLLSVICYVISHFVFKRRDMLL